MKEMRMEIAKIKYNLRWFDIVLLGLPLDYIAQKINYLNINLIIFFCLQILYFWLAFSVVPKQISKLIIKLPQKNLARKFLASCNVLNGILISSLLMLKPFCKLQLNYIQLAIFAIVWIMIFELYLLLRPQEKDYSN